MAIEKSRNRKTNNVISRVLPGLLGLLQMILWIAIIALESVSVYYDAGRGTIYAGFWCSFFFFITWLSMFCYLCFGRSTGCGVYLIIQNIISLIFAVILIAFTAVFINNPCRCYGVLCNVPTWDSVTSIYNYNEYSSDSLYVCTDRTMQKLPVLKGLLSCAVLLLVLYLISIAVFLAINICLRVKPTYHPKQQPIGLQPYQPTPMIYSSQQLHPIPSISDPHYYSQFPEATAQVSQPSTPYEMRSVKF